MRDELLNREIFYTLAEAKILIEAWRRHRNTVSPHSSLGYRLPAPSRWTPQPPNAVATDDDEVEAFVPIAIGHVSPRL